MPGGGRFDPKEAMPDTFRERLLRVLRDPPNSQHDFYPELMDILGSKDFDEGYGKLSEESQNLDVLSATTAGSTHTTDSNDIAIEQFFGRQYRGVTDNGNSRHSTFLVEMGARTRSLRETVIKQLMGYMLRARKAWTGKLWASPSFRTHFTYVEWVQPDTKSADYILAHASGAWRPLDSPQFIKLLNDIRAMVSGSIPETYPSSRRPSASTPRAPGEIRRMEEPYSAPYSAYGPFMAYLAWVFPLDKLHGKATETYVQLYSETLEQSNTGIHRRCSAIGEPWTINKAPAMRGLRDNHGDDSEEDKDEPEGEGEEEQGEQGTREKREEEEDRSDIDDGEHQYYEEGEEDGPDDKGWGVRPGSEDEVEGPYAEGMEGVMSLTIQPGVISVMRMGQAQTLPFGAAFYPDFTVDKYKATGNARTDQISLIVEIGEPPKAKGSNTIKAELRADIGEQLHRYMIASLKHFDRQLYGIAICGTDFCYMRAEALCDGQRRLTTGGAGANVQWGTILQKDGGES
ncbi:hypothetical protein FA13DRAFT_1749291 [Coprinellus micaceus]|uniref:Uncharacterized protein n=1 Tax=Coprinellus micaceus TaxID=71717 RepID=A0A4Y7RMP2_COPMI|nr:hypothetical protein FA13DRAFT_1749291 [Coprinellus micaceus]